PRHAALRSAVLLPRMASWPSRQRRATLWERIARWNFLCTSALKFGARAWITLYLRSASTGIGALVETLKLAALPALEQACSDAFRKLDAPAGPSDIYVAGPFVGIGWGPPIHDPVHKISARWIGGAQAASIFVRVTPGLDSVIHVTIGFPSELEHRLQVE